MIGVFDSGVGGLSVWREIVRCLPGAPTVYLADQAHVPYGSRPIEDVRALTLRCVRWLVEHGCDTVVVACNTASGAALEAARAAFPNVSIVGMEPAVKPAALNTQTGVVGVLATHTTFKSPRYADLIRKWSNGVRVIEQPCTGWVEAVEAIENGGRGEAEAAESLISNFYSPASKLQSLVARHVEPLLAQKADALVLGCTHFPFLRLQIDGVLADWQRHHPAAPPVAVIDPAPAVAQQTQRVYGLRAPTHAPSTRHNFYTTGDPAAFSRTATHLIGASITAQAAM